MDIIDVTQGQTLTDDVVFYDCIHVTFSLIHQLPFSLYDRIKHIVTSSNITDFSKV